MGLSCRVFLLDENDTLYRLPNTKFEQMLRDPTRHRFPRFAGVRVRSVTLVVELCDRQPVRVVWTSFSVLSFDAEGHFEASAYDRAQRARGELALAAAFPVSTPDSTIIDASTRFVAQGGRWSPSRRVARLIDEAALGQVSCPRL